MKKRKSVLHTAALTAFTLAMGGTAWAEGGEQGSGASADQSEQSETGAADVAPHEQERQGQQSQEESQEQAGQQDEQFAEQEQPAEGQGQQSTYPSESAGTPEQSEIKEAQRALKDHELYQGNIDGIVGPQTRSALRQYQEQQQLEVTGSLDEQTKQALGVGEGSERQPVSGMEGSDIQRTAGAAQEYQLSQLQSEQVQQLQQQLRSHGLYQGEVDGILGPQTKSAMREFFQRQAQLVGQDRLSADALQFFGIEASDIQPTSGEPPSGELQQPTGGEQEGSSWEHQQQQQGQPSGEGEQGTQGQPPSEEPGSEEGQPPSGQEGMEDQPQGTTPEQGEPEQPMHPEERPPEYMD